jgi:cellulose synthase/poly-beta-1,6-N-acetylglucosamine synthase-like glycosyltransferase
MWRSKFSNAPSPPAIWPDVSVVIAARNESDHIQDCLQALAHSNYDPQKIEIILVDDGSEDETVSKALSLNLEQLKLFQLPKDGEGGKKVAIDFGVEKAMNEIILTTDADCIPGDDWIRSMTGFLLGEGCDIVGGRVEISESRPGLQQFQHFEYMGNMVATNDGISSGTYFSGNGANMAFKQNVYVRFLESSSQSWSAGQDVFFVQWAAQNNYQVGFNKTMDAVVKTFPVCSWKEFFWQRVRWASKTTTYVNLKMIILAGIVFLYNATIPALVIAAIWHLEFVFLSFILFTVKIIGDLVMVSSIERTLGSRITPWLVPFYSFLHMLYMLVFGLIGIWRPYYSWKGRRIR